MDFPELLLRTYELLERNEPIRRHYQSRFRHILVDEFQDTNRLQYLWLKLLASKGEDGGASLFCVGDDDQSIYRFRGAEIGNMRDFEREFRVEEVIRLEQNYRSHGNILAAANAIITHNSNRLGKTCGPSAARVSRSGFYEAFADLDEARWLVEEIQALIRDGHSRSDVALLYRSNAQSRVLEHQLFSAGIAYRVYGGLRFSSARRSSMRWPICASLPTRTTIPRLHAGGEFPARGIGARSLEQLQDAARTWNTSLYATVPPPLRASPARCWHSSSGWSSGCAKPRTCRCPGFRACARAVVAAGALPVRTRGPGQAREPRRADQRGRELRRRGSRSRDAVGRHPGRAKRPFAPLCWPIFSPMPRSNRRSPGRGG